MINDIDHDSFYFISGYERIHTGYEVMAMIDAKCITSDVLCNITGGFDLLFWFKGKSFYKERFLINTMRKGFLTQVPISSVGVVSSIANSSKKIHLVIKGQLVKTV